MPQTLKKDWNWIVAHNTNNVEMHNISDKTCLLAIQGPNACKILQPLTDIDILNLKYYTFVKGRFAGLTMCLSAQQVTPVQVVLKFILKTKTMRKYYLGRHF